MSIKSRGFGWLAAAALLAASGAANAQMESDVRADYSAEGETTASPGAIVADLFLVRPLSLAGTVLGTGVFVVGLPFEALSGDVSGPARRLVTGPVKFTFVRPLGQTQ